MPIPVVKHKLVHILVVTDETQIVWSIRSSIHIRGRTLTHGPFYRCRIVFRVVHVKQVIGNILHAHRRLSRPFWCIATPHGIDDIQEIFL